METLFEETLETPVMSIADLIQIPEAKESKFSFEFQEICSEIEKYIGKKAWLLPHMAGFTESKIKRAFEIAKRKNILTFPYIIGIIKHDKGL